MEELKAVNREEMVVGNTYYDTPNAMFGTKLKFEKMTQRSCKFSIDAEDYEKSGYEKDENGYISFNRYGDEFYEKVTK
jgi:hypothetical protein